MTYADLNTELRQAFMRLIVKHTGLEIRERDQAGLQEKIFARMKALKLDLPEKYYQFLSTNNHEEWLKLIKLLTNTDSYFFRDKEQFSLLRYYIFPELIKRHYSTKTIRICSAGCSSGEEPYSIAIILKEIIPNFEEWNVLILGLDINQAVLNKAKTGIYTSWSFRNIDPYIQQRYFKLFNEHYHIHESIKQMVKFININLVQDVIQTQNEMRDMDLIVCRNVFIYFEVEAIAKVLDKFYHMLKPSGYLLTGHTELYHQNLSQFETQLFPESVVYQRRAEDSGVK
ncbi:CheR family methyltransferase [Iningainema tapete]|uniref:CheR family methyltransferase n=1 Tax=Iningainema tapete TaxID=2806730 RepID=UPI003080F1F0